MRHPGEPMMRGLMQDRWTPKERIVASLLEITAVKKRGNVLCVSSS